MHEPHFSRRCAERALGLHDVKQAIANATSCTPYGGRQPTQAGTNWRIAGPCVDGNLIAVGVEAFEEAPDHFVLLLTLFEI